MYDSRIARFFAVDPITAQYPMLTPYQHSSLNPIWLIEFEGLEGVKNNDKAKKSANSEAAHKGKSPRSVNGSSRTSSSSIAQSSNSTTSEKENPYSVTVTDAPSCG